jgi:hypothetical protein
LSAGEIESAGFAGQVTRAPKAGGEAEARAGGRGWSGSFKEGRAAGRERLALEQAPSGRLARSST